MTSGTYASNLITADGCCRCAQPLPWSFAKFVYVEVDSLNPQVPPRISHTHCAARARLDVLWDELSKWGVDDFPGRLYHRRHPRELWEMVRDHLMTRFKLEEFEVEQLIRDWSGEL